MIPYKFDISLKDETYTFQVNYNSTGDFFTADLYKDGKTIVLGEKLVYGKPLFLTAMHKGVPGVGIIPYDISGNTDRITFENLNKDVFLYLAGDNNEVLETES